MSGKTTLTMLKPDALENGHVGNILKDISDAGFKIKALKMTQMTKPDAEKFYAVHRQRPFFNDLVSYMISGPIVAAVLEKENAVESFRNLIGATNPAEAEEGTIRKKYAVSLEANAIHGSDSDENANIEAAFHFSGRELF